MTAGSGLLLPTIDELIDRTRPGVLAVLDAADALHRRIEEAGITRTRTAGPGL